MIRPAEPEDVPEVLALIRELAGYERLQEEVDARPESLREHLFGDDPWCSALVACEQEEVVGYALYYPTYSSFRSAPCLFLEDLYVTPRARRRGHGRGLLRAVAAASVERGAARMEWNVLEWNRPAIGFYEALGARVLPDWRLCRIQGEALDRLAADR